MRPAECVGWWRCVLVMGLEITTHHHRGTKAATKAWTKAPAAGWRQVEGGDVVQCSGRVQAGEMLSVIMHHQHQAASHASPVCGDLADICVLNIYFRPSIDIFQIFFVFTSNIFLCCKVEPTSPVVYCPVSGYCPHLPISKSPHNPDPNFQPRPVATSRERGRTQDHIIACHST